MALPGLKWRDVIKMALLEVGCGAWIGFIWFEIGTEGGLLEKR
jgi:hypothetical protein